MARRCAAMTSLVRRTLRRLGLPVAFLRSPTILLGVVVRVFLPLSAMLDGETGLAATCSTPRRSRCAVAASRSLSQPRRAARSGGAVGRHRQKKPRPAGQGHRRRTQGATFAHRHNHAIDHRVWSNDQCKQLVNPRGIAIRMSCATPLFARWCLCRHACASACMNRGSSHPRSVRLRQHARAASVLKISAAISTGPRRSCRSSRAPAAASGVGDPVRRGWKPRRWPRQRDRRPASVCGWPACRSHRSARCPAPQSRDSRRPRRRSWRAAQSHEHVAVAGDHHHSALSAWASARPSPIIAVPPMPPTHTRSAHGRRRPRHRTSPSRARSPRRVHPDRPAVRPRTRDRRSRHHRTHCLRPISRCDSSTATGGCR